MDTVEAMVEGVITMVVTVVEAGEAVMMTGCLT